MSTIHGRAYAGRGCAGVLMLAAVCWPAADRPAIAADALPSETPAAFLARVDSFDYVKREVMIPMRDGVKLQTLILIPRGAKRAPILLTRTPYGATERITKNSSAHLTALIDSTDVADDAVVNGGYFWVVQDVRGKHGAGGGYVMTPALRAPLNTGDGDPLTANYDTIDSM